MSISRNIIALYASSLATAAVGLASAPIYLHWLGIEAYAITGVMVMMLMWFALLDLGLTPALSRSVTQFVAGTRDANWLGGVLAGLERLFGVLALVAIAAVAAVAPWVAETWIEAAALPTATVAQSLMLIGAICGMRLWYGLYVGGLTGLQLLKWIALFSAVAAIARLVLSVAAIAWLWTDVRMLLAVNLVFSIGELAMVRWRLRADLPAACRGCAPNWRAVGDLRNYAGGLALTTLVTIFLNGLDKAILPIFVPLHAFGCYMLAYSASQALYRLITPVFTAVQPRLTEMCERGDLAGFAALYHRGAQATAVMVMPLGLLLAACPESALHAWTGNAVVAAESADVLRILAFATVLHSCMYIPYAAQLAYGWTGLALRLNVFMAVLLVPALFLGVQRHGILAAAWIWLTLNIFYMLVMNVLMTRRILQGHMLRWYLVDLGPPAVASVLCAVVVTLVIPVDLGRIATAALLACAALISTALAALASPLRSELMARLKGRAI